MTPLQRLDDAVHAFLEETGEGHKVVTGWFIGISTSRLEATDDEKLPLVTGAQYAIGPQTSITDAGGLSKFLGLVIERAHWQALNADDET